MEVGIMDRISTLSACVLDVSKLASPQNKQQLVDFNLYNDQDDEGEIMLLAMILLQLHGVKLPSSDEDLLNKKKRQRTSPDQLAILEQIFQTDKMPNQQTRVHLADQLGMSSRRVQIWFQNKRAKVKRSVSKPLGDCSSPSLTDSNSSLSDGAPSSPSSPPSSPAIVPRTDGAEFVSSPAAVVPSLNARSSPNPLKRSLSSFEAPMIVMPTTDLTSSPSLSSLLTATDSILNNTTKQLKAQQAQFSRTAPFVDNQLLLTASY